MSVPNRIREEAAAAEAEMRRLAAEQAATANTPQIVPAGSPTNPAPADAGSPEPRDLDGVPPGDAPHPNAVPQDPPEDGNAPITAEAYAALKQQYETLQGLHNKDRQKLAQTETRLETIERVLQAQMAAREAAPAPEPAAPARREPPKLVKPDEVEEFGADLNDFIRRAAREEYQPAIDDLLDQVQRLNTKVAQLSQVAGSAAEQATSVAEERFIATLDSLVQGSDGTPDWQEIDASPEYLDWLKKVGDDSDEPRLHVLQRAYQRKDAQKCAGFLNAYKREKGLPMGPSQGTPPAAPAAAPANPAAALISPSPVAPAAPANNRGVKKTYTLGEIERTYSDYTKGKFKGREAEFHALTTEYDKATLEGRVTAK